MWPRLHDVLLTKLCGANAPDFFRAAVDGSHIRALEGGSNFVTSEGLQVDQVQHTATPPGAHAAVTSAGLV